jgi:UDP-N-acetylmuramoyl-L-alanyl-D-glutamate--2,6-diaminopimelate ligase
VSEAAHFSRTPTAPVPLSEVCALLGVPPQEGTVTGVTLSSSVVQPGDLYAALPGAKTHGARFAHEAAGRGAVAVLTDESGRQLLTGLDLPVVVCADPRGRLGDISALVYGHPAQRLRTFGVTGTNGKTTVTYMLAAALQALGEPTGLIGTTGTFLQGRRLPTVRTTPEAPDLQALMALMVASGTRALAMEVSSHALVLGRVDGIRFDLAAFTNLSPDHLDFHGGMDEYYDAKARLFTTQRCSRAVINVDDPWGRRLAAGTEVAHVTYGLSAGATWTARDIRADAAGSAFAAARGDLVLPVRVRAPGVFNVANALAAVVLLVEAGHEPQAAAAALDAFGGVPGRMEVVPGGGGTVIVDYAHTPDAVERALLAIRPLTQGKIWCVIGCGGDRDFGKRPAMGRIAAELADHVLITDDNPRSEDPAAIRAAVLAGALAVAGADVREIGDRADAIAAAIRAAAPGDTVMILGKGHETGQEVAGVIHPFDDRQIARDLLEGAL